MTLSFLVYFQNLSTFHSLPKIPDIHIKSFTLLYHSVVFFRHHFFKTGVLLHLRLISCHIHLCLISYSIQFLIALLIQRFPSANVSLPYFAVISAFLFLNHFPFLLKSIKIAVMNISLIFTNRNAITAITFFCYSVSVKLFLLSIYFSITAILFCRKFQTGHAINSPVS